MINFDAVDFSERRSEEVITFFWRSVYNSQEKLGGSAIVWIVIFSLLSTSSYGLEPVQR